MLRAAWHRGRDSRVLNDPLKEPGRTHFFVGLPSAWGSLDGESVFSPYVEVLLFGDSSRYT